MRGRGSAAVVGAAVLLGVLVPRAAQAGCVTHLPVRVSLPDGEFAAAYTKRLRVQVRPRGVRIRNLSAALYTFSGERMGVSESRRGVRHVTTLTVRPRRIFRPMQAGGFTLVLTGEPNRSRSCGPKQATRVLRLRACADNLPVTFPTPPGGRASDYGAYLSVPVSSDGTVVRELSSAVYGFDGLLAGRAPALQALFGERMLDHELARPLSPGRYTVVVEGLIGEQPRACGRKTARATIEFG